MYILIVFVLFFSFFRIFKNDLDSRMKSTFKNLDHPRCPDRFPLSALHRCFALLKLAKTC